MNLVQKFKLLLAARRAEKTIKEAYMSKGLKTTEFWLTVITNLQVLAEAFKGSIDPKTAAIIIASLNAVYAVARSLVKLSGASSPETPTAPPAA